MNLKLLNYAIGSILRRKGKNLILFIGLLFSLTFLISSLFVATSIKSTLLSHIDSLPEITVQKIHGGRLEPIDLSYLDIFSELQGVALAKERVWGYYFFNHRRLESGVNFTITGVDLYIDGCKDSFKNISYSYFDTLKDGKMVLGERAYEVIKLGYFEEFFDFLTPSGVQKRVAIGSVAKELDTLEGNGMLLVKNELAREILGIGENFATDIVLKVKNSDEIETIKKKITQNYSNLRVITKSDIRSSYNALFDFKSGFFLALFLSSAFALFLLIFEKSSGLGDMERREVGTLRAIGWRISDIIKVKFAEHTILILSSLIGAFFLSYVFVFILEAPILREIFISSNELTPSFPLVPNIETINIIGIAVISALIYLALVLIPIWRGAIIDPSESLK